MPERPESVPAAAEWSASDREWVLVETDEGGQQHGQATFWRPDGTLVNRCVFVHGVPHGPFTRYHESGEVSREGMLVQNRIDGLDVTIRSDAPTTEVFPRGLAASVWRVENEWRGGRVVTGRLYDRDGHQVTETGERVPERPEGVPAGAVYHAKTARWLAGASDEAGKQHGEWRFFHRDGWLEQLATFAHGEQVESTTFSSALEAAGEVALREGDAVAAAAHAEARYAQAERASERVAATWLWVRALDAAGDGAGAQARAEALLASDPEAEAGSWGVFMPSGRRTYEALIGVLLDLARRVLAAGDADRAVTLADRAQRLDRWGRGDVQLVRYQALSAAGARDDALVAARAALEALPDAPELAELASSAEFANWLRALDPGAMTAEGARAILGDRGERLEALCAPILTDRAQSADAEDADAEDADPCHLAWDLPGVFGERLSPELVAYGALQRQSPLEAPYRSRWVPGVDSQLGAAVECADGTWVARVQSVFLPASMILVREEELLLAEWHPTPRGNSRVLYQHQDEPEFTTAAGSIAGYLVDRMLGVLEDREGPSPLTAARRAQLLAACGQDAEEGDADDPRPAHLDALALEARTRWIVTLLLEPVDLGGLQQAARFEDWEREREHVAAWPHLAAYWLFHHAVFGNREALAEVVERADARYPAVAELAQLAAQLLVDDAVSAPFWDPTQVLGLRAEAADGDCAYVFSPAGLAAARAAGEGRRACQRRIDEAKAALAARGEETAEGLKTWDLLEACAGKLEGMERAMAQNWIEDADESLEMVMGLRSGRSSMLTRVYLSLARQVDAGWQPLFEAACELGAEQHEDHAAAIPGAFVGLGMATGDFAATLARAEALHPEGLGRQRRIELAVLGHQLYDQPAAQAFLRAEAERAAAQFNDWSSDTGMSALRALLLKDDAEGYAITNRMLCAGSFSGANWRLALSFVERNGDRPELAEGFEACLRGDLGRHDDGDRARVAVALAKSKGVAAVPILEELLGSISDVRVECERAALLAGLATADPEQPRWRDEARACLQALLDGRVGSMQFGAGVSLIRALADLGALEPDDALAAAFRERVDGDWKLVGWLNDWIGSAQPAS